MEPEKLQDLEGCFRKDCTSLVTNFLNGSLEIFMAGWLTQQFTIVQNILKTM